MATDTKLLDESDIKQEIASWVDGGCVPYDSYIDGLVDIKTNGPVVTAWVRK